MTGIWPGWAACRQAIANAYEDMQHPVRLLSLRTCRVARGQALDPIDITRYQLNPPPLDKRNDVNAWKSAVDNANSQLEHQLLRIVNHELLLKHGDKAWRAQTQMDESALKLAESELARAKAELESVNMERKLQQQAAGGSMCIAHCHLTHQLCIIATCWSMLPQSSWRIR